MVSADVKHHVYLRRITYECSESARERRIALYKSDQQQQQQAHRSVFPIASAHEPNLDALTATLSEPVPELPLLGNAGR